MDTCLVVTPIEIQSADVAVEEARVRLAEDFSFVDHVDENLENSIQSARDRLCNFSESTLDESARPYDWIRLSGSITIAGEKHDVNVFVYPNPGSQGTASLCLSDSLFDALVGEDGDIDGMIDAEVKRTLVGLCSTMADVFHADAFAFGCVRSDQDMVPRTSTDDLKRWLQHPDRDLIVASPHLLVGIRSGLVDRREAERHWPAARIKLATSGFLLMDGIGPIE